MTYAENFFRWTDDATTEVGTRYQYECVDGFGEDQSVTSIDMDVTCASDSWWDGRTAYDAYNLRNITCSSI